MSTLLEVAGLAALIVGLFLLWSVGCALIAAGGAVFLYAQTLDDDRFAQWLGRPGRRGPKR